MKTSKSRASRTRGQAAIWLLGTLAASAAVMYGVFNTGQVIVGKERAVNAADAAALAGATAEARLLNLMAYANRGVIANEVFLAQLLSMESWVQYLGRTSRRRSWTRWPWWPTRRTPACRRASTSTSPCWRSRRRESRPRKAPSAWAAACWPGTRRATSSRRTAPTSTAASTPVWPWRMPGCSRN
ncbi:MAG: hypothetical protein JF617_14130 [Burkholderiales bacterium]|nr:hypothetical protein [Burkholderiales bacterium]